MPSSTTQEPPPTAAESRPRGATFASVERLLRDRVANGQWLPGTMVPGRRQLAQEHGVALRTVERAIAGLLEDGTLRADSRRGTFVAGGGGSSLRPATLSAATLGIVGVFTPSAEPSAGVDDYGWARTIITAAERAWAGAGKAEGSHIVTFNRFRGVGATAVPVSVAIQALREHGADAVVVIGIHESRRTADSVAAVLAAGEPFPLVYISWHALSIHLTHLFYDNESAGYQAAAHLLQNGCRNLVFFTPFLPEWVALRLAGARQAVRALGLPESTLRLYPDAPPTDDPNEAGDSGVQTRSTAALLERAADDGFWENVLTEGAGVIAPNDHVALLFQGAADTRGRTAGHSYGLVGFDDAPRALAAGLTTLRPPLEALGEEATALLRRALRGDETALQVRLRSHLIPRSSSRPPQNPLVQ